MKSQIEVLKALCEGHAVASKESYYYKANSEGHIIRYNKRTHAAISDGPCDYSFKDFFFYDIWTPESTVTKTFYLVVSQADNSPQCLVRYISDDVNKAEMFLSELISMQSSSQIKKANYSIHTFQKEMNLI